MAESFKQYLAHLQEASLYTPSFLKEQSGGLSLFPKKN
jgi:hypothetical protein